MEKLKSYLIQYRDSTLNLINCIEQDNIDDLQKHLDERKSVINNIESIEYTKQDFILLSNELDILLLQKKLTDLMMEKRNKVKDEIDKFEAVKSADKNYKKKYNVDSIFFNKKV